MAKGDEIVKERGNGLLLIAPFLCKNSTTCSIIILTSLHARIVHTEALEALGMYNFYSLSIALKISDKLSLSCTNVNRLRG